MGVSLAPRFVRCRHSVPIRRKTDERPFVSFLEGILGGSVSAEFWRFARPAALVPSYARGLHPRRYADSDKAGLSGELLPEVMRQRDYH